MNLVLRMLSMAKELGTGPASLGSLMDVARKWGSMAQESEALLGPTGWALLRSYGRVMSGTYSGQYVSALPSAEVQNLLHALKRGERIPVHLMHRHRSGCYESSSLSLVEGRLLMHYLEGTQSAE
jgi:hypothetical protein